MAVLFLKAVLARPLGDLKSGLLNGCIDAHKSPSTQQGINPLCKESTSGSLAGKQYLLTQTSGSRLQVQSKDQADTMKGRGRIQFSKMHHDMTMI